MANESRFLFELRRDLRAKRAIMPELPSSQRGYWPSVCRQVKGRFEAILSQLSRDDRQAVEEVLARHESDILKAFVEILAEDLGRTKRKRRLVG